MGDETKAGDADAWQDAVSLITGYPVPGRSELFKTLLGNDSTPLMKVELSGVIVSDWPPNTGWGVDNTGYVIAFRIDDNQGIGRAAARISLLGTYNAPGGVAYIPDRPIEGGKFYSGIKKVHLDGAPQEWDNGPLHQYVYGSGLALQRLMDSPEGTQDFAWGGLSVPATDQVNFTTFDVAGASFDRVASFFHHSADRLQDWESSLGRENAAWLGQSAGVFRDLVHQMNRNYGKFAQGLRVTSGGSVQAKNLERAKNVLREAVSDLWAAWNMWHGTKGHPLFYLRELLDDIREHVEINNIAAFIEDMNHDDEPLSFFSRDAEVIGKGLNFGRLNDIHTWHRVGQHAVDMWTDSVRTDLEPAARAAMAAVYNVWNNIAPPPILNMSQLNLEQDYLMDKQAKQEREVEENQKKVDKMNQETEEKNDKFMKDQQAQADQAEARRQKEIEAAEEEQRKQEEEQKKEYAAQVKEQREYEAKMAAEQKAEAAVMEEERKKEVADEKTRIEGQRAEEEKKALEREKRAETTLLAREAEEGKQRERELKRAEEAEKENDKRELAYTASRLAQEKQNEEDRKKAEQRYTAEQLREQQRAKQNEEDRKKAEQRYDEERKKAEDKQEKETLRIQEEVKKNEQQRAEEIKKNEQRQAKELERATRLSEETRSEEKQRYEEEKDQRYRENAERQKQEEARAAQADRATKEFERARQETESRVGDLLGRTDPGTGTDSGGLRPSGVDDFVSVGADGSLITDHPDGTSTVYDPETHTVTTVYSDGSTSVNSVPSSETAGSTGWGSSGYEQELYDPYTDPLTGSPQTLANNTGQNSPYGNGGGGIPPGMMGTGGGAGADGANGERTRSVMGSGITVRTTARRSQQSPYGEELTAPARGNTTGSSTPPMMPPMGGQQPPQDSGTSDRERTSWIAEDEDVWGTDEGGAPAVIGR